jgi:hypothetical protein
MNWESLYKRAFLEFNSNKPKMKASRLLPLMIYLWILAAFIINYSTAAKKVRKNHHHRQKCMTYKNPAYSGEMRQNLHKRMKRVSLLNDLILIKSRKVCLHPMFGRVLDRTKFKIFSSIEPIGNTD